MTATRKPMGFFHTDGLIPAWNFAKRYAGRNGHVATVPDIVQARLASNLGDNPWERYYVTATAEYYGISADGRPKLIVAHGVGPMSTIDGIKRAYSWEYKDKSRERHGGHISAEEFLKLEIGGYGDVTVLRSVAQFLELDRSREHPVFVVDFLDYVAEVGEYAFMSDYNCTSAGFDLLLLARLGLYARLYLAEHNSSTKEWFDARSIPRYKRRENPCIIFHRDAGDCNYTTALQPDGQWNWRRPRPRPLEEGMAIGHLIVIENLLNMNSHDDDGPWTSPVSAIKCQDWTDNFRFMGVPAGTDWYRGVEEAPQPGKVLRTRWRELRRPIAEPQVSQLFYRIEKKGDEWFTRYRKSPNSEMHDDDVEFHVRSVRQIGGRRSFEDDTDGIYLHYDLSQIRAIAPEGANAFEIVGTGKSTAYVKFYVADVDATARIPRAKEIKQDYSVLMG